MKNSGKKFAIITFVLVLTISVTFVALPIVSAHDPPWDIPTYAYLTASPDPVGVGQTVTLVYWLDKLPPTAAGVAGDRWVDLTIDVTKPDGSEETLGPWVSDPVGGGWALYTPDQVGTYTFVFNFPGQVLNGSAGTGIPNIMSLFGGPVANLNDTYLASSATATLTVQQDALPSVPSFPLPTEYWARPIDGQNTDWFKVASNWLSSPQIVGKFQPDGIAPNSAHVMWTKPFESGGVVGGSNTGIDGMTFYDGTNYESKFVAPIILNGRVYYELPKSDSATGGGYVCLDLLTGEEIWCKDYGVTETFFPGWGAMISSNAPSFGQLFWYNSMNQHGVIPNGYLWSNAGATWNAYDPLTGNSLFNLTGAPSGTEAYGPNGEILIYNLNIANKWLALWNNTAAHDLTASSDPNDTTSSNFYQFRPVGKTANASQAYSWNVTIPEFPAGSSVISVIYDDMMIGQTGIAAFMGTSTDPYTVWAISLEPASRGQLLWSLNYSQPAGNLSRSMGTVDPVNRVFMVWDKETIQWTGYSIDDGSLLWTTESENPWNIYSAGGGAFTTSTVAYGKLFSTGYSGTLYCYDTSDGALLWEYRAPAGFAAPYPGYPLGIAAVADGKIYLHTNEHSSQAPYWKGCKMRCVNATSGEEIWTLDSHGTSSYGDNGYAIADGYLIYLNLYDMQINCIGKGPSATTVTAGPKVSTLGSSLVIEGTVIDTAAGTKQNEQAARFPNGVPAMSDASMGAWMEYVYMQKPMPEDAEGVEVVITTLDPNGNTYELGRTTTDTSGTFGCVLDPPVPGKYKIIATFEGSDSYYPSSATTYINVEEAPSPAQPIEPEAPAEEPTVPDEPTAPEEPAEEPAAPDEPTEPTVPEEPTEPEPTEPTEPTEAPLITTELAIILAVVVVAVIGIAAYWVLRKRK